MGWPMTRTVLIPVSGQEKKKTFSSWQQNNDFDEALSSWDNESIISCVFNDGCVHDDVGNLDARRQTVWAKCL
ncbi:hypothetical protein DITRI_Ditri01bG0185200 [Diplodiscus trichospermus]